MTKIAVITMMPLFLFGGVIEAPASCNNARVVQELKNIVKSETGFMVENIEIKQKDLAGFEPSMFLCQCRLNIEGLKMYKQYTYTVAPIDYAFAGLDKRTIERYKTMPEIERKKYVRVEFVNEIRVQKLKNPIMISKSYNQTAHR